MYQAANILPQVQTSSAARQQPQANNLSIPLQDEEPFGHLPIQRKLSIGAVDDLLEHEADAMADKVMRMPEKSFIQRKCNHCEEEENGGIVQRKPLTSFIQKKENNYGGGIANESVTSQINATKGNGAGMDNQTKSFMENRFGASFQDVRIHTGNYASQLSQQLNAQAFTVGNDVYFNQNKYTPETAEGKHLLAHELTHTIQQGNGIARKVDKKKWLEGAKMMPFRTMTDVATAKSTTQSTPAIVKPNVPATPDANLEEASSEAEVSAGNGEEHEGETIGETSTTADTTTIGPAGKPNFEKATDCNIVIPEKPEVPTPLPFVYNDKAVLPEKEVAPDLSFLQYDKPWWGDASALLIGQQMAACYAARTATTTKIVAADKLVELQKDFNEVVQGSFGRSTEFGTWWNIKSVLQNKLTNYRKSFFAYMAKRNKKANITQTKEEMDIETEKEMQQKRHNLVQDVRIQVALGIWAWKAERREKMDFETLGLNKSWINPLDPLSKAEKDAITHDILVKHGMQLTEKQIDAAKAAAQKTKDAKAKKDKIESSPLTDAEQSAAVLAAEEKVFVGNDKLNKEWKTTATQLRNEKDKPIMVIPNMKEWEIDGVSTKLEGRIKTITKLLTEKREYKPPKAKTEIVKGKKVTIPPPELSDAEKERVVDTQRNDAIIAYMAEWIKEIPAKKEFAELLELNKDFWLGLNMESGVPHLALTLVPPYLEKLALYKEKVRNAAEGNWTHKNVEKVLLDLRKEFPQGYTAGNYKGHGGGGFENRFYSADMYPNGGPKRYLPPFGNVGFFDQQIAYDFALAIDRAVGLQGGRFEILYNDFAVAREVNKAMKNGKMFNTDNVNKEPDVKPTKENPDPPVHGVNLNWHGPIVTHFHVDFRV